MMGTIGAMKKKGSQHYADFTFFTRKKSETKFENEQKIIILIQKKF